MRMVCALLDLARLGQMTIHLESVDPAEIARSAFEEMKFGALGKLASQFVVVPMPRVRADRRLLRQVFVNRFSNAVKFSKTADAPRVEVEALVEGPFVRICVCDNGVGFTVEQTPNLFEPFFRGLRDDGALCQSADTLNCAPSSASRCQRWGPPGPPIQTWNLRCRVALPAA